MCSALTAATWAGSDEKMVLVESILTAVTTKADGGAWDRVQRANTTIHVVLQIHDSKLYCCMQACFTVQ